MGFKISWRNGEIVQPTNEEYIADALAEVRDALLERTKDDPRIWSGYPDGWKPGDEDGDPHEEVGLFLNLERCTRSDPSWQIAMAIRTAFALGRLSENGGADVNALYERLMSDWRRENGEKGGGKHRVEADKWRIPGKSIWSSKRGSFIPRGEEGESQVQVAREIERQVIKPLGKSLKRPPQIERIIDTISDWDKVARASVVGK
jgi:hypothetical protein